MKDKNKLALALLSAVALQGCATVEAQSGSQTVATQPAQSSSKDTQKSASIGSKADYEKCYGIAKAGENGCRSNGLSCSGHSTRDGQANAWILVPQGLCNKIAGGRKG